MMDKVKKEYPPIENIIGISGRMCSGKDTLAKELMGRDSRYDIARISAPIVDDVARLLEKQYDTIIAHKAYYRPLLQDYAGAIRTLFGQDHFALRMVRLAQALDTTHLIVPDVRTPADVGVLRGHGRHVYIVRLHIHTWEARERYKRTYGVYPTTAELQHESEWALVEDVLKRHGLTEIVDSYLDSAAMDPGELAYEVIKGLPSRGVDFRNALEAKPK